MCIQFQWRDGNVISEMGSSSGKARVGESHGELRVHNTDRSKCDWVGSFGRQDSDYKLVLKFGGH